MLIDTTAPTVSFPADSWTDRFLGHSRDVSTPKRSAVDGDGNNAAFGGDLAPRIPSVRLAPPAPQWHKRKFALNLKTWVPANRGAMLARRVR